MDSHKERRELQNSSITLEYSLGLLDFFRNNIVRARMLEFSINFCVDQFVVRCFSAIKVFGTFARSRSLISHLCVVKA